MEAKKIIIENLKKAVGELALLDEEIQINLQEPKEESHGDYASNIALILGKKLKKNPLELSNQIVEILNTKYQIPNIDRVEAVAPGFINFYLSKEYLVDQLLVVLDPAKVGPKQYGAGENLKDRKVMIEFTDPNPFKEFHIGHLYSNAVGEALSRLLESQGALVRRVCYQGDVGLHVAKAIYGLQGQIENKIKVLGQAYARGARAYEEDEHAKKEINQINKKVYDKSDPKINELYEKGRAWSLEYFEKIYQRLGTKFTGYYFESEAGKIGLELVKKHISDGIFEESEGAVIFPGEKYGLHNRVFINSLGLPTYEAKDMGLPSTKYKDFQYDLSIIITANEQNAYFQVVLKALSLINPDLAPKTKHIGHGMVRLPSGKMSSRTGDVITGEWLLDEAKQKIKSAFKDMDEQTAEKVAVGAVKYALIKSGIGRDISFSFEESISLEGNSGPYLQYTFARTQSVLAKFKVQSSKFKATAQNAKLDARRYTLNAEEVVLLRTLNRFPEVVGEAAENFAPNILATYLFDLAQKYNLFYQKHQIISSQKESFRVALTSGVGQVIKNGLYLLGISAPEHM